MVLHPHFLKNFPVCCDLHSQSFSLVNKTEVDVFLELCCLFDDPVDGGNMISGSSAFCKNQLDQLEVHDSHITEAWLGEF